MDLQHEIKILDELLSEITEALKDERDKVYVNFTTEKALHLVLENVKKQVAGKDNITKNKMPKVAEMLGVGFKEVFKIKGCVGEWRIQENGLAWRHDEEVQPHPKMLMELIRGNKVIERCE